MNSVFHAPAPAAESRFPLSFAQERMWFLYRLAPANASYHVGMALRCTGMLDSEVLHWALSAVVRRHDVLRTVFVEHEGIPYQRVDDSFDLDFEIIDPAPEKLPDLCLAAAIKPFCLESAPGVRAVLLRLSGHDHVLQITLHHIISDAWSINILLVEAVQLYEAFLSGRMHALPPLQLQYWQFAAEERAALLKNEMESDLAYWRKQLEGMVPTQLPADRTPPSRQTNLGAKLSVALHSELFGKIQELRRKEGLTLFMVLIAGLQIVLGRWIAQEDIAVGTAVANRKSAELEALIGLFVNTLVIRTSLSGKPTVTKLCKRVRHVCLGAYAHQDFPFDRLVIELNPERNLKRNPLFQTMFTLENAPAPHVHLSGLRLEPMVLDLGASAFDMALSVWETKGRLEGWLEFSTGVFEAATMKRFWEHWSRILGEMANDPGKEIANLEMLGQEEQQQILEEWGHGERMESSGDSLQSRFEEYVVRTPEAVAVQHGSRRLSYMDLEQRTNQTANYLKKLGVGPEVLVGVCIQRSLDMIVALLGILKAGGAYVPLDPEYPEDRLAFMLKDTKTSIVMTHTGVRDHIPSGYQGRVIDLQQDWPEISTQNTDKPGVEIDGDNLAYVIYTSGSTGKPKGVSVPHRAVIRLITCKDYAQFGAEEVVLQLAPLAFDASTLEIWGSLLNGGRLAIMDAGPRTTQEIGEVLSYYGVTTLWLTAGLFHTMVDDQLEKLKQVRQVLAGGDVLSVGHVARYLATMREDGVLINGYGPTECTTFTCCHRMSKQQTTGSRVPIGRPIGNTQICVLNGDMQPVGVGELGELYIGGEGLARGYLNWPELTAERFVPNNFATQSGERLYRSGDLVRWQPDGILQFIGRIDNQLKLRGYRIELGEVEAALTRISGVNEAAVIAVESKTGDKLLVAYVAGNPGALPSSAELRRHLLQWLPEYMVPSIFVEMEELPLTSNGKVDRRELPKPERELEEKKYVGARNATEEILSGIWSEVLEVERVGVEDNFFELGGHSLLAMQLVSRVRKVFSVELPLRVLFDSPTVAGVAERIEQEKRSGAQDVMPGIGRVDRGQRLLLSFAQQRLWFLDQLEPRNATYNVPMAVRMVGELDKGALGWAVQEIVRRHEVLRTRFPQREGVAVQEIENEMEVKVEETDLDRVGIGGGRERNEQEEEATREATEEAHKAFDLARGPLVRVKLLRLGEQEHVLLVTMHHIVSDGWSMGIMVREFCQLYEARCKGEECELPKLPIQYADFSVWQRKWLQGAVLEEQLRYWRGRLAGTQALELPTDRPRPAVMSYAGGSVEFRIGSQTMKQLKRLSRQKGTTLYMTLLAAFQTLLHRYSGQEDIAVGSPIAGRRRTETERLIGFFVNTLVLRTAVKGEMSFTDLLQQVRDNTLAAYTYQDVPFEKVVEDLQPERDLSHTPLFQVMFVLQNAPQAEMKLGKIGLQPFNIDSQTTKFDLTLVLSEDGEEVDGWLSYNRDVFDRTTIERMIGHYRVLLSRTAERPEELIAELPLLLESERQQLLVKWNRTAAEYPDKCIHESFEEQAERTPGAVAVEYEGQQLTYGELNRRTNQVGHYLRRMGVRPEVLVGICMERSLELVVGLLGILKAGGAYVPLDPAYPVERLKYMVEDAGLEVVLTQSGMGSKLTGKVKVVCLDEDWELLAQSSGENPRIETCSENTAYVIYTSGSTGKPKGVVVSHANVLRLFAATQRWFEFSENDVWTLFHSCAFDFSVWELWGALLYGGRLQVISYWVSRSPEAMYELLKEKKVTVLNQTPSAFRQLSQAEEAMGEGAESLSLRLVIFGGEALEMGTVRGWLERHGEERPQLVNMYGITETTVHVTYQRVTAELACGSASVIGVKIPDLQLYVLEEGMEPAAIGVVGELYVGGGGVTRGYLGRAELTAERFVPHPYSEVVGERLYRSGDLGRYRADGTVEYLGRMDHQVKIHGHRIELGEIETVLQRHGAVSQAAVVAREEHGEKRLVSYVVYREGEDKPSAAELRQHLQKDLPEYMVPWAYVEMERLPLTTNGKLDRKALPTPERGGDEKRYVAPRNSAEETLCGIWAGVLGVARVGIEDNFFELGGDSILSIQVVAQGRTAGLKFNLRQIFEYQTIAALVAGMEKEQEQQGVVEDSPVRVAPFQLISEEDRKRLPEEVEDAYPLSKLQAGMLFHSEFSPETAIYHDIFSYYLKAPLDLGSLRRAVLTIVIRHPVLRTSFDFSHYSEPLQLIHCAATIPIQVDDIRGLSLEEQEAATARWIEAEKHRPFDSAVPGLLRIHIHKRSADSFEFHFSFHHMILDGWSVASLLTELFGCYLAELKGEEWKVEELGSSFREFVTLEQETMKSAETRRYWEEQLEDVSAPEMPWTGRQAGGSGRGSVKVEIGEELSAGLKGRAQEIGVSLKTVLLAAHMRVLGMLSSGKQDVITGLVSNGRVESSDGERVLGLFLNTVPLWMGLKGGRWLDLMRETAAAEGALLAHRRYPLAELQRQAGVGILFDVTFNFTNFHVYRKLEELGLQVLDVAAFEQTNFVLVVDFNLGAFSPEVHLKLDYDRALIEERQIEAIAQYYQNTLRAMVARPEERYETAELLTEAESQQLLIEWNVRRVEYREACVHELFEEQVTRMPAALALEYKNEKLTYTELNRRANQVAHYLRHLGVGSEVPVGMCMERSLEMVVGLLGILKAGGAYVPLDPEYPVERLKYMLENAEITVLLTQQKVLSQLPEVHVPKSLALDDQWQQIARESDQNLRANAGPQNLAYLIYTSGSTGRPKGVAITHKALSNHMQWMQEEFGFHSRDRILQKTPVSFDASVWEFYAPLLSGGQLVMLEPGGHRDAVELGRKIVQAGITVAQMVPTLMNAVIAAGGMRAGTGKLRLAVCGGEELKAELAEQIWQAIKGVEVVNLYGPTETTIDASYWRGRSWKKGGSIPIGKPVSNLGLYVLDGYMQPVPVGVRGELYIRGTGLARGYWQSPELTAEKFVPNPFSANGGERLYRTGDLVRWSRDGNLEFVGRKDQQVKIRGQRIELKEIEAALLEQEEVKEAVVVVREHTPGDKRLVAYYTAGEKGAGREVRAEELCQYLEERLPGYMVPGAYVRLEKLPLMPNGKLDRKSLPEPDKDLREEEYVGPRNATEETLCRLWQEVLRRERVGIHDNFFDTGGHSLLAIQVISRIKLAFSIEMPLSVLFTAPTVARMAEHIAAVSEPDRSQLSPVLVNIQPHGSLPPFFCVHAVGGQVISYGELSQELGHEQPFYGLQSPPADLFPASDVSIEQMATLYIREIRAVQPVGPYLLGGWSMGGLVAWEMAQQLAKQGERIKLLALIDTIPLSRYQLDDDNTDEIFMLARFALDMSRLVGRDPAPLAQRFSQSTEQDQWNMVQDALISYGVLSPMTAHTEMTGLLDVFTRNFLAGKNYIASPNNQQVVFFRASETPEHLAEPWTTLAVGGIHFHSVPGDHFTILTQPTVRIIADFLQEYILKAYEQPLQPSPLSVETKL